MLQNKTTKSLNKEYPLQHIQYEQLEAQKKVLIKNLCYLFVYYASKGSKHSYYQLQQYYFMEMMVEVWQAKGKKLHKNKGQWKNLQILYHTIGIKHSASFKKFLQLLPAIAGYAQPDMNTQDSLKSLMHHLINVYQLKILPQIQGKIINIDLIINLDTRQFIGKLINDLTKLYKVYFPHEINHKTKTKNIKNLSIQSFLQFLKDFEVSPKILSARDVFYIFNQCCQSPPSQLLYQTQDSKSVLTEQGQEFKLSKFIQSLVLVSKRTFPKLKQVQNEQQWQNQQKYILKTLSEYMQTIKTTNKKKVKYITERFCFIVLDQHPERSIVKSVQVKDKDKIIKESGNGMGFFNIIDKLKL